MERKGGQEKIPNVDLVRNRAGKGMPLTLPFPLPKNEPRKIRTVSTICSQGESRKPQVHRKAGDGDKKVNDCRELLRPPSRWNRDTWKKNLNHGILNIQRLRLCEIPEPIFKFDMPISVAYMNNNKIETLPDGFFEYLPLLTWIDLQNNQIQYLPNLTREHEALRSINLNGNLLVSLPYSLSLASNLKNINVENNPLIDPPEKVVKLGSKAIFQFLQGKLLTKAPDFEAPRYRLDTVPEEDEGEDGEEYGEDEEYRHSPSDVSVQQLFPPPFINKDPGGRYPMGRPPTIPISSTEFFPKDIYTMGLWRDVPFYGCTSRSILGQALHDVNVEHEKTNNKSQNLILQKLKDKNVLGLWREKARLKQIYNPVILPNNWTPIPPFGTEDDEISSTGEVNSPLPLDKFDEEFKNAVSQLQELSLNPATDVNHAQKRLHQLEKLRKKLVNMRIESQ